MTSTRKVYY